MAIPKSFPLIFVAAKNDRQMKSLRRALLVHGLHIYYVLTPIASFSLLGASWADILIVDVSEKLFPFKEMQIVTFACDAHPGKKIVVLADSYDEMLFKKVIQLGAIECVYRDEPVKDIASKLNAVLMCE